ncbi:MAG: hypothetical protein P8P79_14300 [Halioglobus sp.]|nr:hypothetical protein [Halioglobus sp.]
MEVASFELLAYRHLIDTDDSLDEHQREFLEKKKQELAGNDDPDGDFPANSQLCGKCHTKAVIFADGCMTCLSCGDSKCS